jgi:two-component system chemotaxis response regulator CheY
MRRPTDRRRTILESCWLDLVLTDYNMPDMDGLSLLHRMKQSDTLRDIPVVMVTTEGSERRLEEFIRQGAVAFVRKPFTPEQIRTQLNLILGEPHNEYIGDDRCDEDLDF